MEVHCGLLDHRFELPARPQRVVCLTSGTTEALFEMGCGERVVGVSEYCARYVPKLDRPVAGDYLRVNAEVLTGLRPDLILIMSGVQRTLGLKLVREGLPVFALPLPNSIHGILENIVTAAALLDEVAAGRRLVERMTSRATALENKAPANRPAVYAELWLGKHLRTIGGRSFIHDTIKVAGGAPLFGDHRDAYLEPPLDEVERRRPEVFLGFSEPEYPIDFRKLSSERGWDASFKPVLIESTVERGHNVIHDGPSLLETADWLQEELRRITERTTGC